MHTQVVQLRDEIQQMVEQHRSQFREYSTLQQPDDFHQQCARNALRNHLTGVVTKQAQGKLKSLLQSSSTPQEVLQKVEAAQCEYIDALVGTLEEFRAETTEEFRKLKEEEAKQRRMSAAAALELEPSLQCLDSFMRQLSQEVGQETAHATEVHTAKLQALQQKQMRFVAANDSPEKNPVFAKVLQDMDSTKHALEEHKSQHASCNSLLEDWTQVLREAKVAKVETAGSDIEQQQQAASLPAANLQKRTLFDRILGRH